MLLTQMELLIFLNFELLQDGGFTPLMLVVLQCKKDLMTADGMHALVSVVLLCKLLILIFVFVFGRVKVQSKMYKIILISLRCYQMQEIILINKKIRYIVFHISYLFAFSIYYFYYRMVQLLCIVQSHAKIMNRLYIFYYLEVQIQIWYWYVMYLCINYYRFKSLIFSCYSMGRTFRE